MCVLYPKLPSYFTERWRCRCRCRAALLFLEFQGYLRQWWFVIRPAAEITWDQLTKACHCRCPAEPAASMDLHFIICYMLVILYYSGCYRTSKFPNLSISENCSESLPSSVTYIPYSFRGHLEPWNVQRTIMYMYDTRHLRRSHLLHIHLGPNLNQSVEE